MQKIDRPWIEDLEKLFIPWIIMQWIYSTHKSKNLDAGCYRGCDF